MKWALVNSENIVMNVVESIEQGDVQDIDDLTAVQVQDWINIGDSVYMVKPADIPLATIEELKAIRNEAMSQDMTLKACWGVEKKTRPELSFSDYLDELEEMTV